MTLADPIEARAPGVPAGALGAIARGGAANLAGSVVTGVSSFALTVLIARAVSPEQAGVFFSTTSLFLLVTTLGQLGTATGVVYFVARARALGRAPAIPGIVRTAMRPVLVVGVVAAVGSLFAARGVAELVLGGHADMATTYLRVLAVFVPVAGAEVVWLAAVRGFGSMRTNALVELVGRPLLQLLAVAIVLPTHSPGWIAFAWGAPYAVAAAFSFRAWRRRCADLLPALSPTEPATVPATEADRAVDPFWRFTGPRALTSVVQMVMQRFDIVLVGALAGAAAAAVYAAATRFVVIGQSVTTAFTQATQPGLSQALLREDRRHAADIYQLSTAWLVVLTWPIYLLLLVYHALLLRIFGHGYGGGSGVLIWLSISMLVSVGCGLVDVVLAMAGHTGWNLANSIVALACNVGLDLWLIPAHGIIGAAAGWAVAIGVRNVMALLQVAVAMRLHPFASSTAIAAMIAVGCFGVVPLGIRMVWGDTWSALVASVLAGSLLWLGALWAARTRLRLEAFRFPTLRDARGPHGVND